MSELSSLFGADAPGRSPAAEEDGSPDPSQARGRGGRSARQQRPAEEEARGGGGWARALAPFRRTADITPLPEKLATWNVVQKTELKRPIVRPLSRPAAAAKSEARSVMASPHATHRVESPNPSATLAGTSEDHDGKMLAAQKQGMTSEEQRSARKGPRRAMTQGAANDLPGERARQILVPLPASGNPRAVLAPDEHQDKGQTDRRRAEPFGGAGGRVVRDSGRCRVVVF